MMRGNQKVEGGCCPDPIKHKLSAGKDVRLRDDQVRMGPRLKKLISAKLAARALGQR